MLKCSRNDTALESKEPKKMKPSLLVYHYELSIKLVKPPCSCSTTSLQLEFDNKQESGRLNQ